MELPLAVTLEKRDESQQFPSRELVAKAAAAGRQEVEENNRKNPGRKLKKTRNLV